MLHRDVAYEHFSFSSTGNNFSIVCVYMSLYIYIQTIPNYSKINFSVYMYCTNIYNNFSSNYYICYTYIYRFARLPTTNHHQPTTTTNQPPTNQPTIHQITNQRTHEPCTLCTVVKIAGISASISVSRAAIGPGPVPTAIPLGRPSIESHSSGVVCGRQSGPGLCRFCPIHVCLHRSTSLSLSSSLSLSISISVCPSLYITSTIHSIYLPPHSLSHSIQHLLHSDSDCALDYLPFSMSSSCSISRVFMLLFCMCSLYQ